ncbi:MAG: inositol monophosphatase [Leptospiraceae bacterium]|nr:inositol monophosphatase [Leptospiraceae bacterium]
MRREIIKRHNYLLDFLPKLTQFVLKNYRKKNLKINLKGTIDLVTEADKGCEKLFISFLRKNFPDDHVLAEEGGSYDGKTPFKWIIDPLDGTTNFSQKLPLYAISIGIEDLENKTMAAGIIALPSLGEVFHCIKTKGAFKNKKKIKVSSTNKLINSVVCTGFPYKNKETELNSMINNLKSMIKNTRGVRRTGAAALDLCWVAEGKFDGFWETKLNPWDIAAGSLLVEEAGGQFSDFSGKDSNPYVKTVLATNGKIHKDFIKLLKKN